MNTTPLFSGNSPGAAFPGSRLAATEAEAVQRVKTGQLEGLHYVRPADSFHLNFSPVEPSAGGNAFYFMFQLNRFPRLWGLLGHRYQGCVRTFPYQQAQYEGNLSTKGAKQLFKAAAEWFRQHGEIEKTPVDEA